MKTIFVTQILENYGTETAPHWKGKGGMTYILNKTDGSLPVEDIPKYITSDGTMFREYVVAVEEVEDDFVPEFEADQRVYEYVIRHYEPRLTIRDGVLIQWKKVFGYDDKEYIWAYNKMDNDKCVWKNDNAKALK